MTPPRCRWCTYPGVGALNAPVYRQRGTTGMRLPTRDSVRAIGVEIERLRHANASRAKVEEYEPWRDRTVDFLFVDNKLRHARSAGRRTTGLWMRWLAALLFCRMAEAAARWQRV